MACRDCRELLLSVIDFLFVLVRLAMIGYGIYMLFTYNNSSSSSSASPTPSIPPPPASCPRPPPPYKQRRSLLQNNSKFEVIPSSSFWSSIPTAWFLYVFIAIVTLFAFSGYIAVATENGWCLSCYAFFVGLGMIAELALAAFMFFDESWREVIPDDSTGQLDSIEDFVEDNPAIIQGVALGVIIVQAVALLVVGILRAIDSSAIKEYETDDKHLIPVRASSQPLPNWEATSGTGIISASSDSQLV